MMLKCFKQTDSLLQFFLQEAIDNPQRMVYNKNDEGTPATVAPLRLVKKITARLEAGGYLFALFASLKISRKYNDQYNDSQNGIGCDHGQPGASEGS